MSCCGKIGQVLKKLSKALKKVLVVVLVAFAAWAIFLAAPGTMLPLAKFTWLPAWASGITLSAATWGYIALGAAILIDSSTVTELAGKIGQTIGKAASAVAAGVAGAAGGFFSGSGLVGIAVVVGFWYFFLRNDKKEEGESKTIARQWRENWISSTAELPAPSTS